MPAFKDSNGREWLVALTVADLKRVRAATGADLGRLAEWSAGGWARLWDLLGDAERFVDVLHAAISPALDKAGVTPEQFAASLAGDALDAAKVAFVQAYADFGPSRSRPLLLAVLAKGAEVDAAVTAERMARVTAVDPAALLTPAPAAGTEGETASGPPTNSPA